MLLLCALTACSSGEKNAPAAASTAAPTEPTLAVQVNQVALELHGPKIAVVEYSGAETAGTFDVLRADTVVQSGQLTAVPEFTDWGAGKRYFQADFSALDAPCSYRVRVTLGKDGASSPHFDVAEHALFHVTADKMVSYFRENRWLA